MSKPNQLIRGRIFQSLSGFYYVWANGQTYTTKPRGVFRHQQLKPMVGDWVDFEIDATDPHSNGRLIQVLKRKNQLVRPVVSNVDAAFIVMSLVEPDFSYNLLDYFLVTVESYQIEPIIILTKQDLLFETNSFGKDNRLTEIKRLYQNIGYHVLVKEDSKSFKQLIRDVLVKDKLYIVMGQSGVGKSTMLNALLPEVNIETGEISLYLNRGKHTTREVTLYPFEQSLLADTPGFSAMDFANLEKEDLANMFPEFVSVASQCRFRGCLHINEPGCQVKNCVISGQIAQSRYDNYSQIFDKITNRKPKYGRKDK